ncbi:hypothetical protein MCUN1_001330 [Malassezia cuniculi]|uniref:Uncharacterized protein n=1 Tax=Malassezia cuniculi TaxID=948313 RepID=A0AAF0ETP9_9BASI|nr:hypothetical protein MCUN1_001330 [Malassezia cuniculi]
MNHLHVLAILALAALVAAQDEVPVIIPDYDVVNAPVINARADANASQPSTTNAIPTPTKTTTNTSNRIESSGTAGSGATATVSADTSDGPCSVSNNLDGNQQAAWDETWISTCCTQEKSSICWYRFQSKVSAEDACRIPNCAALNSNDMNQMIGFRPMSGTNGQGKFGNIYPIIFLSAAVRPAISVFVFFVAPILVSLIVLL